MTTERSVAGSVDGMLASTLLRASGTSTVEADLVRARHVTLATTGAATLKAICVHDRASRL